MKKSKYKTGVDPHLFVLKRLTLILHFVLLLFSRGAASAQLSIHGEGDEITVAYPESEIFENRGRLYLKAVYSPVEWFVLKASGYGEYLLRRRVSEGENFNFRIHETYMELRSDHVDLRLGYSNILWGVLDEIQPNDVVNPLDVSRFLLENRSQARLPIPLVRARIYLPEELRLDLIAVPFFEKGVFDQLDEETSPFNLIRRRIPWEYPPGEELPNGTFEEMEYGSRLTAVLNRVDLDLYVFKGRKDFPIFVFSTPITSPFPSSPIGRFPRYTLFGGDIEAVIGRWGVRGEGAFLLDDTFQHPIGLEQVEGNSFQVGFGTDRKFGDHIINWDAVYLRRWADGDFIESKEELNLIAGMSRSFQYELSQIKIFLVYNPMEETFFLRWNGSRSFFQDFWIELSMGLFIGSGNDLIGRFETADFLFLRGKYHF